MSDLSSRLAGRECGQYPLSIGTSIPIEALAENRKGIDYLYVNVRTLIRNIYGSLDDDTQSILTEVPLADTVMQELGTIFEILDNRGSLKKIETIPYWCTLRSLHRYLPDAIVKSPRTKLQQAYFHLEEDCLKVLAEKDSGGYFQRFDCEISGKSGTTVMLTHHAVDLCSYPNFSELVLLESHTGTPKRRNEWHTKLTGGKELTRMPFNKMTLSVYGDRSTLLFSQSMKIKEALTNMAEQFKWHPNTTKDRILYSINALRDPVAKELFKRLVKSI